MGVWLKRHPAHFLEGNYLRYVGWVLSDAVRGFSSVIAPSLMISIE